MRGDVADIAAAQAIRVLSLRYFNPIGADPKMRTGQPLAWPTHALGKMIQAYEEGVPFVVTGTDYPTRDGSGIRDYIHVWDLAAAHVAALDRFDALPGPSTVINLGTGRGTTVRELLDAFNHVVQSPSRRSMPGRRPGDTAGAYTRIDRAVRLLGWQPEYDITEGIRHSLQRAAIRDEILSGDAATPTTEPALWNKSPAVSIRGPRAVWLAKNGSALDYEIIDVDGVRATPQNPLAEGSLYANPVVSSCVIGFQRLSSILDEPNR